MYIRNRYRDAQTRIRLARTICHSQPQFFAAGCRGDRMSRRELRDRYSPLGGHSPLHSP